MGKITYINEEKLIETLTKINSNLEINKDGSKEMKTGYPSIDQPWWRYYPESARTDTIREATMWQVLRENSLNYLNLPALGYFDNTITFEQMLKEIERCARSLVALGIKKGSHVAMCMPNVPEFVYIFYALNKIGAIPDLMEPRNNAERILEYLNDSGARYMFMVDNCYNNIEKIASRSNLEKIISVGISNSIVSPIKKAFLRVAFKPVKTHGKYMSYQDFYKLGEGIELIPDAPYEKDATAVIVYTSGTTGVAKGVELRNESYNGQNLQIKYSGIKPQPGEVFLGNVPFFSAYGSSSGMHNAMSNGIKIELIPSPELKKMPKYILKYKPTHVMGSPRHFEETKKYALRHMSVDFSHVKNFISGGDKMSPAKQVEIDTVFKSRGGPAVKIGLGSTEHAGGFTTTNAPENNLPGSTGIPLAQNVVVILDPETLEELPYGKEGEIYVSSITHANGYLNKPEQTNQAFFRVGDRVWFKTGDTGYMTEDGSVYFADRITRAIMRPDGHTVSLVAIENAIENLSFVDKCAVIGIPENLELTGELPMAYIVLKDGVDKARAHEEIKEYCDKMLPEREKPYWFRYVDSVPYTLMEKVDYKKLKSSAMESLDTTRLVIDFTETENEKTLKKSFVKKRV